MSETAAVYARVSSEAQRKERTIESQLREVPAFCTARGWSIVETYIDDGKSAATGKLAGREAFARLLADATAARFTVVAVIALDRLTRTTDLAERGAILGAFQAAGVKVAIASTGQVLDLRTDAGDLMGSFGAYVAGLANRQRLEATMRGKREMVERGGKPQGSTPVGLLYDRDREAWAVDPVWAVVIREIHERVARLESTCSIARDLAKRDGVARPRGGIWTDARVRQIVTSETYTGRLIVHRKQGRVVAVPPVVDADLAAEARAVLSDRYRQPPPRSRHHHLLSGLLRCGLCGARVGVHGYTTADGPVHSYLCMTRRMARFGGPTCELPRLPVADIDAAVWSEVSDLLTTDVVVERAYGAAVAYAASDDLEAARAKVAELDALTADVLGQAVEGLVSRDVADAHVRRLGLARKAAALALRDAQAARAGIRAAMDRDALAERVGLLSRWCADPRTTAEQRQGMMRALVAAAVLRPEVLALDLRIPVDPSMGATTSRIAAARAVPAGRLSLATRWLRAA